jgi:muramoyltetrapeptide carboxypeptidase
MTTPAARARARRPLPDADDDTAPPAPRPAPRALEPAARPPHLRPGDVVAVVSPSGPVPEARIDRGVAVLRSWGLEVRVMAHARAQDPERAYLAGTDEQRADDFAAAWLDPDVRAVVCARGGYGAQRMVDLVDWGALRGADPTVLVGFSDVTALHQAVAARLGLVTLYGPMAGAASFLESRVAQRHLRATLCEPESVRVVTRRHAHVLHGGVATGVTTGGCLSLLTTSVGAPNTLGTARGGIVLLEDVDEKAYRVDAFLTHLRRSGWFDGAAGVGLGSWQGCDPDVEEVVAERLAGLDVPVLGELGFGHCPDPRTVPLGVLAHLDAGAGRLTLEEPALA